MKRVPPAEYLNQVSIPEGSLRGYAVEHFSYPPGYRLNTSNPRTSLIGGQKNKPVVYDHRTTWHRLTYEHGVWMTDEPIEQQQHRNLLAPMRGDVLVGGLGLGLAANWLAQRETVKSVTVVEISSEVISLVSKHIRDPRNVVKVVCADLLDYLQVVHDNRFDWAFYDIWQSDGERTFFKVVCPLRSRSVGVVPYDSRVICWNEDVMRGQLAMGLHTRYTGITAAAAGMEGWTSLEDLAHPQRLDIWTEWCAPFFQAVEKGVVKGKNLMPMIRGYAGSYGRPGFEDFWFHTTGVRM